MAFRGKKRNLLGTDFNSAEFHVLFCVWNFVRWKGRYIGETHRRRYGEKETEGKRQWERDRRKETEGKRQRKRDRGKEIVGKRQRERYRWKETQERGTRKETELRQKTKDRRGEKDGV